MGESDALTRPILSSATAIANEWQLVAIAWHVALVIALFAVALGWRPSARVAGCLSSTPFLSVSTAAWASGNPFNGAIFAALFLVLITLASRDNREPGRLGGLRLIAAAGVAYGAVGVFVLRVELDYVLLAGALGLMAVAVSSSSFTAHEQPAVQKTAG